MTRLHSLPANVANRRNRSVRTFTITPQSVSTLRRSYRLLRRSGCSSIAARCSILAVLEVGWMIGFEECSDVHRQARKQVAA